MAIITILRVQCRADERRVNCAVDCVTKIDFHYEHTTA